MMTEIATDDFELLMVDSFLARDVAGASPDAGRQQREVAFAHVAEFIHEIADDSSEAEHDCAVKEQQARAGQRQRQVVRLGA